LDVNKCYEKLLEIYTELVQRYVPFRTTHKLNSKTKWLTNSVKKAIREKNVSWIKYLNFRTDCNLLHYNQSRNKATRVKREAKKSFEEDLIESFNGEKFYSYVRSKTTIKEGIALVKKPDGTLTKSDQETADELNIAFHSVYIKDHIQQLPAVPRVKMCAPVQYPYSTTAMHLQMTLRRQAKVSCYPFTERAKMLIR
jgi:hypothetical protein